MQAARQATTTAASFLESFIGAEEFFAILAGSRVGALPGYSFVGYARTFAQKEKLAAAKLNYRVISYLLKKKKTQNKKLKKKKKQTPVNTRAADRACQR